MAPYLEQDASHSSDSSCASGDAVTHAHANPRGSRSSSYTRSPPGGRCVPQEAQGATPDNGEALVVTNLEDKGGDGSSPADDDAQAAHIGKARSYDASSEGHSQQDGHSEGSAYHNVHTGGHSQADEYMWPQDDVAAHTRRDGRILTTAAAMHSADDDDEPERWWSESGPVATVKLVLETDVGVITRAWPLHQPVHTLKVHLSHTTQVPPHFLQLSVRGRVLGDGATLRSLGVEANETVQVSVSSKRPHTHPLTLLAPTTPTLPTPDVITVIVEEGGGVEREVVVEVEWRCGPKPWLGGFRHRITGLQYHNAATQTQPPPRTTSGQVSRGTQTVWGRGRGSQTPRNALTQTTYFHPLLHTSTPILITPRDYCPARYDVTKVLVLQRTVRGWLARRQLYRLAQAEEPAHLAAVKSDASSTTSQLSVTPSSTDQHKAWRQPVPMTELYSRLENWRRKQVSQVNATLKGKQRRRALVALLDKETELLRSLEAHRAIRSARRRNAAIARFLQEVSRAQVWEVGGAVGGGVEVETPDTQPIRTLAALATALQQDATADIRAQQFKTLSNTVKYHHPSHGDGPSNLHTAEDLQNMATRGLDLLSRGTSDNRLRGLRKRLHTLIITYLHQVQSRVSSVVAPRTVRAAGAKPVLFSTRMT